MNGSFIVDIELRLLACRQLVCSYLQTAKSNGYITFPLAQLFKFSGGGENSTMCIYLFRKHY